MLKTLIVVAHPDDETIWMGGTILQNKNWELTILSLCRSTDTDRAPKFKKVCEFYNAKGIILDLEDEKLLPLNIKLLENLIRDNLQEFEYDFIYTHGKNGEYGHIRHKEVHEAVTNLIKARNLKCSKVYYFSYFKENSEIEIKLTKEEFDTKKMLITKMYGFDERSLELGYCKETEEFDTQLFEK